MCFNVIFLLKRGTIEKIIIIGPLEKLSLIIWGSFSFLYIPTLLFEQYSCQTWHTLFLEDMIVKYFLFLSKLAAHMVTSTSSENLFYQRYKFHFILKLQRPWIYTLGRFFSSFFYGVKNVFHENPVGALTVLFN